jgi:SAM-dependent methyltransferase
MRSGETCVRRKRLHIPNRKRRSSMSFRMNSPQGKAILALIRKGDYAHPGEEEAVEAVASGLSRSSIGRILDVGCGRGGTAGWFHRHGWGEVVGIDRDADSIDYAKKTYPHVRFHACDVAELGRLSLPAFDLAYLFSSLYAFADQQAALGAIRDACREGAHLVIFDYTQPAGGRLPATLGTEIGRPIVMERLMDWMQAEAWQPISVTDMTGRFVSWYDAMLRKVEKNRQAILETAGEDWYDFVASWYGALRDALAGRHVGGSVIHATAFPRSASDIQA